MSLSTVMEEAPPSAAVSTVKESSGVILDTEKFKDSVFVVVKVKKAGFRRKVKDPGKLLEYLEKLAAEVAAKRAIGEDVDLGRAAVSDSGAMLRKAGNGKSKAATSTSKALLFSPALDALRSHLDASKSAICGPAQYGGIANQSGIMDGVFEISIDRVSQVKSIVAEATRRLTEPWVDDEGKEQPGYLTAFLADYPAAIDRAKNDALLDGGLGPLFDVHDYPTMEDLSGAFGIARRFIAFSVPEGLKPSDKAEALAELRADLTDAAEQIKIALRTGFEELITHARDTLTVAPGEKPKIIKASLLGNVLQFCETFQIRNTQGDAELAALVEEAKSVLTGMDPDKIRKYASVREQARALFDGLKTRVDEMIVTQKGRVMDLSEE